MRKIISIALAAAMALSSMTAVFARTADEYDNVTYSSLDYDSSDDDGEINLAVIAKNDVNIVGDSMYIEGSVYSAGTIYGGNGDGNTIEGLLISGTENQAEKTVDGDVIRYGYVHVDDDGNTDVTNGYSTGLYTDGAILDTDTSFDYSYTEYDYPEITNYVETATANQWSGVLTVSENTHFGTVDASGAGFIIDTTNGDVTVVIDTMNVASNPYIATVGDGHVNLYVKNWVSENNVNLGLMNIGSTSNYNSASGTASVYDNWAYIQNSIYATEQVKTDEGLYYNIPRPKDAVLQYLDPSKIDFYIDQCKGSDEVIFNGCRIAANIHSNASKLEVGSNLEIYGDITSGCAEFETIGSGYINGTVTVPNAASTVHNSSTIQGQLITDTLLINGAGAILNQTDSINLGDDTNTDTDTDDDSDIYLNIIEDVVYVVIGDGYPKFTLNKNTKYKWEVVDNANVSYGSNSLNENAYYPGYFTADDVTFNYNGSTGYNAYWGVQPGDTATVKATSVDDSSVYDTAKIIFVASEDDIPKDTEEEPEDDPFVPDGDPIDLSSVRHAYIFGDEPEEWDEGEVPDIEMAPERAVQLDEVCAMITRLIIQVDEDEVLSNLKKFGDSNIDGEWFAQGMQYLNAKGYFDTDEEKAEPYARPTRGQVAKLIVYGLNLSGTENAKSFDDVDSGSTYAKYIDIVTSNGYMDGYSDTEFGYSDSMTRTQFCKLFNNITNRNDYTLATPEGNTITAESYNIVDIDDCDSWEVDAILRATSAFTEEGYVDLATRQANIRNISDNYEDHQTQY